MYLTIQTGTYISRLHKYVFHLGIKPATHIAETQLFSHCANPVVKLIHNKIQHNSTKYLIQHKYSTMS